MVELTELELIPTDEDPPVSSPALQRELQAIGQTLRDAGIDHDQMIISLHSATGFDYLSAEFIVKQLPPGAVLALAAVAVAWIKGRSGRKVRVKVGGIEVEARTPSEVERLLEKAAALRADAPSRGVED